MARRRQRPPPTRASAVKTTRADGTVTVEAPMKPRQLQRHLATQDRNYGGRIKREAIESWFHATGQLQEGEHL